MLKMFSFLCVYMCIYIYIYYTHIHMKNFHVFNLFYFFHLKVLLDGLFFSYSV